MASEIGLLPWDFWRLTPAEFAGLVGGYRRRGDRDLERLAWQTAHLLNLWTKKKTTPDKLLGRRPK